MPLLVIPLFVVALFVIVIPLSLVQRYRMGTSRQRARGWLATLNLVGLSLSVVVFFTSAALTSIWIPHALTYSLAGFALGMLLGILGLWLTQWEQARDGLHYTPNRMLVLAIMLIVVGRIGYGIWRGVHAWRAGADDPYWLGVLGVAGSLAAGAIVLGYYFAYWFGVRRKFRRHAARAR